MSSIHVSFIFHEALSSGEIRRSLVLAAFIPGMIATCLGGCLLQLKTEDIVGIFAIAVACSGVYLAFYIDPIPWQPLLVACSAGPACVALFAHAFTQLNHVGRGLNMKQGAIDAQQAQKSACSLSHLIAFFKEESPDSLTPLLATIPDDFS